MNDKSDIEKVISDTLIERPYSFTANDEMFKIYPFTFAKMQLYGRLLKDAEINEENMADCGSLECLRMVENHKREICAIISLHTTPNTKEDLFNEEEFNRKIDFFCTMEKEDIASLFLFILQMDRTNEIMQHIGLDKENERMKRAMSVKDDRNSVSFGGLSVFGSFIGPLKEMGYTDNQIRYEHSYSYLRLMLADKINTIYLTDDECKRLPKSITNKHSNVIKANSEIAKEMIKNSDWS